MFETRKQKLLRLLNSFKSQWREIVIGLFGLTSFAVCVAWLVLVDQKIPCASSPFFTVFWTVQGTVLVMCIFGRAYVISSEKAEQLAKKEVSYLEAKLEKSKAAIQSKNAAVTQCGSTIESLRADLDASHKEVERLKSELDRLKQLESELGQAEKSIVFLTAQLQQKANSGDQTGDDTPSDDSITSDTETPTPEEAETTEPEATESEANESETTEEAEAIANPADDIDAVFKIFRNRQ